MDIYAFRLHPGDDLKQELDEFARRNDFRAGIIITCVGSLCVVRLRLADRNHATQFEGKYEIVALTGTFSPDGSHYHIALSNEFGQTIGGHLLTGCRVYTTAEIVMADLIKHQFRRPIDPETGYDELIVGQRLD